MIEERLRELLAKTSGALPWEQDGCAINSARVPHPDYFQPISLMTIYDEGGHTEDDAALIVEAVNALPTVLARIAALEDALRAVGTAWDASPTVAGLLDGRVTEWFFNTLTPAMIAARKALGKGSE